MLHQIGSGALGPIYRAFDKDADRLIAIKAFRLDIVPEETARLAAALRRLVARTRTTDRLVLPLYAGLEGHTAYVALPLAGSDSLDAEIRRHSGAPMPAADAWHLIWAIAMALDDAAMLGLRHGALHPRDVVMDERGDVRVAGVGVVPVLEDLGIPTPIRRPYTAPERVAGGVWDNRADVYSLGVIAHELLTGRRPARAGEQDGSFASDVAPELRVALRQVLGRALAEDPAERFQTAREFSSALAEHFQGVGPRSLEKPVAGHVPQPAAAPVVPPQLERRQQIEPRLSRSLPDPRTVAEIEDRPLKHRPAPPPPMPVAPVFESLPSVRPSRKLPKAVGIVAAGLIAGAGVGYVIGTRWLGWSDVRRPVGPTRTGDTEIAVAAPSPAAPEGPPVEPPVEAPAARVASVRGRMLIRSTPSKALVTVDGAIVGDTPLTLTDLSLGSHVVQIARPGHLPWTERVSLTQQSPSRNVSVQLQKGLDLTSPSRVPLDVDSRPRGARVTIDGRFLGVTPLRWPDATPGTHRLQIEMGGYTPITMPVVVRPGEPARVAVTLREKL